VVIGASFLVVRFNFYKRKLSAFLDINIGEKEAPGWLARDFRVLVIFLTGE
jgi:hypothetical protein